MEKKKNNPLLSALGVNIYIDESGDLGFPNGLDFFTFWSFNCYK